MKEALRQNHEAAINARRNLKTQVFADAFFHTPSLNIEKRHICIFSNIKYVFQLGEARAHERQHDLERENLRIEFHEGKLMELEKDLEDAEMANKIRCDD